MRKFFFPNIERKGRIVRLIIGIALIVAGSLSYFASGWLCIVLLISGGFVLYEAARGWCLMRACGIRTRL